MDQLRSFASHLGINLTDKDLDDWAECLAECEKKYPNPADSIKLHQCQLNCPPDALLAALLARRRSSR